METLEFFGFKPTYTVLEFGPGGGWFTELLAPALAKKGKLIITGSDPNGPADQRSTLNGERQKLFLERSPELYGKVEMAYIDNETPDLKLEGTVDLIVCTRELHGMVDRGTLDAWLKEFHEALKTKGTLGIEQHRAKADAVPEESVEEGLPAREVADREGRGRGLQARRQERDQRQPEGHQGLREGRLDAAAELRRGRNGPREVRRHRRERSHDAQVHQEVAASDPAPWPLALSRRPRPGSPFSPNAGWPSRGPRALAVAAGSRG